MWNKIKEFFKNLFKKKDKWEEELPSFVGQQVTLTIWNSDMDKELEKILNMGKQKVTNAIEVKTLLVSIYANCKYDATGVDLSQLEERGIAHHFGMHVESMEELLRFVPQEWVEELEIDIDQNAITVMVPDALLLELEDGTWIWDY